MTETATINGITYLTHSSLTTGDYGGAGSVGVANLRVLANIVEELAKEDDAPLTTEVHHVGHSRWQRATEGRAWSDDDPIESAVVIVCYAYGGQQAWVREDVEDLAECIACLEGYPLLDDEEHSAVETEWEEEAWESWLRDDLLRTLDDETREVVEDALSSDDIALGVAAEDALHNAYIAAMQSENEYPVSEHSGVYVDVSRIADAFAAHLTAN